MNEISLFDVYMPEPAVPFPEPKPLVPNALVLDFLYDLMKERDPEINISHSTLPTFKEHVEYVRRDPRPYRYWYVIVAKEDRLRWVGTVSASHRNEIGIVLRGNARGKGYGPRAIRLLMALADPLPAIPGERNGHWIANIAPGNLHSQHVFQKLGFRPIQITYEYHHPKEERQ